MDIKNLIQTVTESAKINFAGHKFLLKVDTNEDPQKKGVKVQFIPTEFGSISSTEQNDIAIELESRSDSSFISNTLIKLFVKHYQAKTQM